MSLQENWNPDIPPDTGQVGRAILGELNPYRQVGDHVSDFLHLDDFADLYDPLGRGGICPIILSLVLVFQFLENIPDRIAAQWAVSRIDWKYALHMPLDWQGFHYADLSYFRKRLIEHGAERLIFERVLDWARAMGVLKKHARQRTDSSHVLGKVERLSRLELAWETMRVVLRAIKEAAPTWYQQVIPASFHETYVERQSAWRMGKEEIRRQMQSTGSDGYWLLDHIDSSAPELVRALPEVEILRQVWEQQFDRRDGQTIVRKPPIRGKDVLASPHETEARWAKKRGKEWIGYKLHTTETVEPKQAVQFITDIGVSAANDDDSEVLDEIQQRLIVRGLEPKEQYVDRGYVSGPNIALSGKRGIELVGPLAGDSSGKPKGFRQADFEIDLAHQRAVCPSGQEASAWYEYPLEDSADGQDRWKVDIFFGAACRDCPQREQCRPGKRGRQISVHPFYAEITARRAEQQSVAYRKRMNRRAGVEGTIFGLVWSHGARRARYRGKAKEEFQLLLTGAAANLKRLCRALRIQQEEQKRQSAVAVGC